MLINHDCLTSHLPVIHFKLIYFKCELTRKLTDVDERNYVQYHEQCWMSDQPQTPPTAIQCSASASNHRHRSTAVDQTTGWLPAIDRLEAGSCIQPRPRKRTAWGNRFVSRTKCYRGGVLDGWSGIFLLTTGNTWQREVTYGERPTIPLGIITLFYG